MLNNIIADTSMGLMKAFHYLLQSQRREPTPKYTYAPAGRSVHARRRLTKSQNDQVKVLVSELHTLDPKVKADNPRIKELIEALAKLPVKFVPIKRETRIDNTKVYPYHDSHYSQQAVR